MQTLSDSPRNKAMVEKLMRSVDKLLDFNFIGSYTIGWDCKEGTIMVVTEETSFDERTLPGDYTDVLRPRIVSAISENNKQAFTHNFYGRCEVRWTIGDEPEVKRLVRRTQT